MAEETRKLVFELVVNNKQLLTDLGTVGGKLKDVKDLQKQWLTELDNTKRGTAEYAKIATTLGNLSAEQLKLQEASKAANQALKLESAIPGSYAELKAKIALTRTELDHLKIGSDDYKKKEAELNDSLQKEIDLRTAQKSLFQERVKGALDESNAVKSISLQLKDLQKEMMNPNLSGEQFSKLAKEAGLLKDQIQDTKEATKEMSSTSSLTNFGNVLGGLKSKIFELDFKGAAEKAKLLAEISKEMTFAEAIGGMKDFGVTLANLGKALLTNPLFIMAAAIGAIVVAFKTWSDSVEENEKALSKASEAGAKYSESLDEIKRHANEARNELRVLNKEMTQQEADKQKVDDERQKEAEKTFKDTMKIISDTNAAVKEGALTEEQGKKIKLEQSKKYNEALLLLNQEAADKKAAIDLKASNDASTTLVEGFKKDADTKKKALEDQQKINEKTENILDEYHKKEFLKQNEHDLQMLDLAEKMNEELIKLESTFRDKIDQQKKKDFDEKISQLREENSLTDQYLSDKFQIEITHAEEDKQKVIDSEIMSEEKKAELIRGIEKRITQIKGDETKTRLGFAANAFGNLAQIEAAAGNQSKAGATGQALVNTYLSATESFAALAGIPIVGPGLGYAAAALAIGAGLSNVARINGVKFGDGGIPWMKAERGIVLGGEPHSRGGTKFIGSDGTRFEAEKDELLTVVNKRSTSMLRNLSNLNVAGGGVDFFSGLSMPKMAMGGIGWDGGYSSRSVASSQNNMSDMSEMFSDAVSRLPRPVVAVEDINHAQNVNADIESRSNF